MASYSVEKELNESYCVCEATFGILSENRSVNGRAGYLGSRSHCTCKKYVLWNCSFVLFFSFDLKW